MLPDGAEPLAVGYSQEAAVTFDSPGVYGYQCVPHAALGMVGIVVVGAPAGIDQVAATAEGLPAQARRRMEELLAEL